MLWTLSWDASVIQYHFNLLLSNRCSRNFIAWNLFWRFWRTVYSKNVLSCLLSASFSLENSVFFHTLALLYTVFPHFFFLDRCVHSTSLKSILTLYMSIPWCLKTVLTTQFLSPRHTAIVFLSLFHWIIVD